MIAPRLVLGDHGFMRRYGSTLSIHQISDRMREALASGIAGLAAGDERCLIAARAAGPDVFVLHHTDVAFTCDGRRADFGRCMATLLDAIATHSPRFVARDPIVGAFVRSFGKRRPYAPNCIFDVDEPATSRVLARIATYRPACVTVGGDYLDALLVLGQFDVAARCLTPLAAAARIAGGALAIATYVGALVPFRRLAELCQPVDALMVPLNKAGLGMVPTRPQALRAARALRLPLIAMHPLGSGRLAPASALEAVFADGAAVAVVGASSRAHVEQLVAAISKGPYSAAQTDAPAQASTTLP